jgi:hypothetical protein
MKLAVFILSLIVIANCYAEVLLYRYTDKATGEERGVAYGITPDPKPEWNYQIIQEDEKLKYIELQEKQLKDKQNAQEAEKDRKKNKAKNKLKGLGFDNEEIRAILGDKYGE